MIPARTRATNFVLDVLERKHGWKFNDDAAKSTIYEELETMLEETAEQAVEEWESDHECEVDGGIEEPDETDADHDHETCVPASEVLIRRARP